MARSHHRHKKHHPQPPRAASSRPKRKAAPVFAIFLGVFGLGIGYFAAGTIVALVIGALIGIAIGYLIGHNLDRMAIKK
jgi:hypothetical protein